MLAPGQILAFAPEHILLETPGAKGQDTANIDHPFADGRYRRDYGGLDLEAQGGWAVEGIGDFAGLFQLRWHIGGEREGLRVELRDGGALDAYGKSCGVLQRGLQLLGERTSDRGIGELARECIVRRGARAADVEYGHLIHRASSCRDDGHAVDLGLD